MRLCVHVAIGVLVLAPAALAVVGYDQGLILNYSIRGDVNGDGVVNVSDPVALQDYLFQGGAAPPCENACDANDDGSVDNSDSVYLLNYLYLGGPQPPAPGPFECGMDETQDDLGCDWNPCLESDPPAS